MTLARLSSGQELSLGRKLAEGGEGRIHELNGTRERLVKLYHKPVDDLRHRKLVAMAQIRTAALEAVAAWPIDVAYDANEDCIGFVMPRISGPGIIDKLSHPAEQRIAFPTIDYGFLVHVAMNLMRAASTLHAYGCVIGDVNESNVYILNDGTVRFIDVDSFQVQRNGEVFPCNVGTPIYTPPELQGATFRNVTRTPNHDTFGLSVLVFQLLVQGCHPFAGVPRDGRGRTIEEAIREGLYAYSVHRRDRVSPPPDRLPLSALGELAALFERSFLGSQRPTAAEWMNALDRTRSRLHRCAKNPRHRFVHDCGTCPLCRLPRDPFPHYGEDPVRPIDLGGLSIGDLIREAGQLPTLRPLAERCSEPDILAYERSVPALPRSLPTAVAPTLQPKRESGLGGAGGWSLFIGLVLLFIFPPAGVGAIILGVILFAAAGSQANAEAVARAEAAAREAAELRRQQEASKRAYEPLRQAALLAIERLGLIEARAREVDRSANAALQPLAKAAAEAREWLSSADHRLQAELRSADNAYRKQRLTEYLERQIIAHASIPDIGTSRKAVLASFGIETAADVERHAIQRIPGFGPHLTDRLLSWRRGCEQKFSPRGKVKAPPDWLQRIRQQHNAAVASNATRLRGVLAEYRGVHSSYDRQLATAAVELDRARRDCRVALNAAKSA